MRIQSTNTPTNNISNFKAKLIVSNEAKAVMSAKIKAMVKEDPSLSYSRLSSNFIRAMDELKQKIAPIEPKDFPIVIKPSERFKQFAKHHRSGETFDESYQGLLEICPNNETMHGTLGESDFSLDLTSTNIPLSWHIERLYYGIRDIIDELISRNQVFK